MGKNKRFPRRNNKYGNKKPWQKNKFQQNKKDIVPQEKLKEVEVGITQYISTLDGFSGIIKARFSDFHVNEINLDGEIAKLTTTRYPEDFYEAEVEVPDDLSQIAKPVELISDEIWTEIIEMLQSNDDSKIVELDVTDRSKEDRTQIHTGVKKVLKKKIVASTIVKDENKFLQFKKYNGEQKDNRVAWPSNKGKYVYFLVYKESTDTIDAAFKISDCLRMKSSLFTYAGVKDKRAKTTQWFCVKKLDPRKLILKTKPFKNIHIGNLTFKHEPLKLGQLSGNRFRIALRNITAEDEVIDKSLNALKENGFINYYGLQRFGNDKEVPTYEIGIKLMQGNWKEACDLILKLKKSDDPDSDVTKAKKIYQETADSKKAYEAFDQNKNKCVESKLLYGLSIHGSNDYVNALEQIPRNMRLLYIHSFQSLIWNKVVSQRIKEFGLKPIVGDIVLVSGDENVPIEEEILSDNEASDEGNEEDKSIINKQEVKILTNDDLENYTIYDIVLPLPGYDVKYPENEVKLWYKNLLEEAGLTLEMPKQKVKTYTLSGDYRKILGKAQNLSWYTSRYNDPNDNLIYSDYEELRDLDKPVDDPNGKYKALIMDFCLNPSNYATMVLREILKTDTSSAEHTKLNNYHENNTVIKKTEEIDYNKPTSLLADADKFEDFKRAIFSAEKRKIDNDNEEIANSKKLKETPEKESSLKVQPSLI